MSVSVVVTVPPWDAGVSEGVIRERAGATRAERATVYRSPVAFMRARTARLTSWSRVIAGHLVRPRHPSRLDGVTKTNGKAARGNPPFVLSALAGEATVD